MNIAIVGCGYVGQAAARFWKAAGYRVTATTRNPDRVIQLQNIVDHVVILQGDLSELFAQVLIDQDAVLLCMAADHSSQYESTYLHTAQALAKAMRKLPRLKQILYTSSTSIYGEQNGQWIDESTPPAPSNDNAKILLATEQTLQGIQTDSRHVCIFRLGEIIGPERQISSRLLRMEGRSLPGTGANYTNLIHLQDIVEAVHFGLSHQLSGIYNLCNDVHIPRSQLYDLISEKNGLPKVVWDPTSTSIHAGNKRVSSDKLKAAGYSFCKGGLYD